VSVGNWCVGVCVCVVNSCVGVCVCVWFFHSCVGVCVCGLVTLAMSPNCVVV